jgi:hypothetical protein
MKAEKFLQDSFTISHFYSDKYNKMMCFSDDVQKAMVEFAKIKVEEALNAAAKNAKTKKKEIPYTGARAGGSYFVDVVDTDSILNAYPLKKIK